MEKDNVRPTTKEGWDYAERDLFHATYFWEEGCSHQDGITICEGFIRRKNPISQNVSKADAFMKALVMDVCTLYAYLGQCSERTVEVRNSKSRTIDKGKKPWLRDDLPYIVLLDPKKATQVGCHRAETGESNRKSPNPHDRRGHSRQLKAIPGVREAKSIHVRPAWIGPTTWEHKGRIYKVVQDRKVDSSE